MRKLSQAGIHGLETVAPLLSNGISQSSILEDAKTKLSIVDETNFTKLSDFDYLRVTKEKDIPQPEPTITIGGAAVASPGNITAIGAAATAFVTAAWRFHGAFDEILR